MIYRNSPVSFIAILLIGVANGAFGTLAPVFGADVGLSTFTIATMMSITIFSGAVMQVPAGRISDRMDRRYVLAGLAAIAGISGLAITLIKPDGLTILFGLISLYGAMSYTLYSITVAHANDFAPSDKFVTVSSGLLLLYGVGTIIGPLLAGLAHGHGTASSFRRHRCRASRRRRLRPVPDPGPGRHSGTKSARTLPRHLPPAPPRLNPSISIRAPRRTPEQAPAGRVDCLAFRSPSAHVEHDLADVIAILHPPVRG
jgi:hypothetical protein